jgi:hypothetical protein
MMIWSVCILCSFRRFFTSRCQISSRTSIHWDTIEIPRISHIIWCYFTVIQRILVWSQIWNRELEELLKLHNQRIDHVMTSPDLRYLVVVIYRNCRV